MTVSYRRKCAKLTNKRTHNKIKNRQPYGTKEQKNSRTNVDKENTITRSFLLFFSERKLTASSFTPFTMYGRQMDHPAEPTLDGIREKGRKLRRRKKESKVTLGRQKTY